MFELYPAIYAIALLLFITVMTIKNIKIKRTRKRHIAKWKKKKFHVVKNDKTQGYIESVWEEIRKG